MKKWNPDLWLLSLDELILTSIMDENETVGEILANDTMCDTRYGLLAWGLTEDSSKQQNFHEQLLLMIISS